MKPVIAITIGDINGIGPEVVLKSLSDNKIIKDFIPLLIGPLGLWENISNNLKLRLKFLPFRSISDLSNKYINVFDLFLSLKIIPGKITSQSGLLSVLSIFLGHQLCSKGLCKALVTSPISKEAINLAGFPFTGHTEMLAKFSNTKKYCMVLLGEGIRTALVTTHLPISEVAQNLDKQKIFEKIEIIHKSLLNDFKIKNPKIAVLGLNPHAGDGGVIGIEEEKIIIPAIQKAQSNNFNVKGPFPADGFFARYKLFDYDAIIAMYHDQGLIPLKMLDKGKGVNFTAGLDIIRTSPDHGTAFDIAGKNIADPESMKSAIRLAKNLVYLRKTKK